MDKPIELPTPVEFKIERISINVFILSRKLIVGFIEMDRGSASRVMGTLFTLIEPDTTVTLHYSERK